MFTSRQRVLSFLLTTTTAQFRNPALAIVVMSSTTTFTKTSNTASNRRFLVDIGVNLMHKQFHRDREDVVQRCYHEGGVGTLILTGCSVRGSIEAQEYCEKQQNNRDVKLFCTAGVHPHDAKSCDERTLDTLRRLAQTPQVVAIGECGLDYDRNFSPPSIQREWFEKQLQLACDLQMPVFLHERKAHDDFLRILSAYSNKLPAIVVHCFTGTRPSLEAYLSLPNCYIGITGWVCDERRGQQLRTLLSLIPDDRLMIETDAPFLFPRDLPKERLQQSTTKDSNSNNKRNRGRRNEPAFLDHICRAVAECRGQASDHVAQITTGNAIRFFQLPKE